MKTVINILLKVRLHEKMTKRYGRGNPYFPFGESIHLEDKTVF